MDKRLFHRTASCFSIPPRKAGALYSELTTWIKSSGLEWTIKRFKRLKSLLVDPSQVNPESGFLTGAWGKLLTDQSVSLTNRLHMVNVYKSFIANDPTESQLEKFYSSMESKDVTGLDLGPTQPALRWIESISGPRNLLPKPYMSNSVSAQRRLPTLPNDLEYSTDNPYVSKGSYGSREVNLGKDLAMSYDAQWWGILENCEAIQHYVPTEMRANLFMSTNGKFTSTRKHRGHNYVGSLGFIQEPGYKLRVIANPLRGGQFFLTPVKDLLLGALRNIESDCTHDQGKGVRKVQSWLREGLTVFTVDLTDATNLFPWPYQREVLKAALRRSGTSRYRYSANLMHTHLDLVDAFVSGVWSTPDGDKRFTRGQPLGLGPSFPLFALSHHCLLEQCGATKEDYVILGDDICISNPRVHNTYRNALDKLGCKVSLDKCVTSSQIAEFGGKLITANSYSSTYKWAPLRDSNVMELLSVFGPRILPLVPEPLLDVVPTLCTLPRYLGGCGWTPPSPYKEMVSTSLAAKVVDRVRPSEVSPSVSLPLRFKSTLDYHSSWVESGRALDAFVGLAKHIMDNVNVVPGGIPVPATDMITPTYLGNFMVDGSDRQPISSRRLVTLAKQLR